MNSKEFLLSLPEKVNTDALADLETNFHFVISDSDETHEITVKVADGECTSEEGLIGDPNCIVKSSDKHLMNILKGDLNPMMAILTGKLKISNQGEMLKYAKIFGLM